MDQINKLVDFALSQVGYKETPTNITKYSAFFEGTDFYNGSKGDGKSWGAEWCDIYVDYCFCNIFGMEEGRKMLCQPKKSAGAGCKYSAQYYKNAGRWFTTPEKGDQIFFGTLGNENHTGIVTDVKDGKVFTVEGNSGDEVKKHQYSLTAKNSKIAGYGRPIWVEEVSQPVESPVKPPEASPMASNKKDDETIAKEVISGKWGNGEARKKNLTDAGYDYEKIQKMVNQLMGSNKPSAPVKDDTFIGIVNTQKSKLNIRAGASAGSPIIGTLTKGSKVKLKAGTSGWYKLADKLGYVSASYIKKS